MPTIRKRGQKYQARVRNQGQLYEKSFASLKSAEQWVASLEAEFNVKSMEITSQSKSKVRFATVLRDYAKVYTPTKRGAANELIIINRILRDESWVLLPNSQVTLQVLTAYRDKRLQSIKPSTFKREFAILKHCARVALALGYENVNVEIFKNLPIPKVFERPINRITDGDIEKLLFVCRAGKTRNRYMHPLIRLALDTGMRRNELCSLVWGEVDFPNKQIKVPAHKAKSGKARTVVFTMRGYDALLDLEQLAVKPFVTKYAPPKRGADDPVVPATGNAIRCAFEHIREAAGFPEMHFHDLRHEAISRMHEEGLTKPEIMSQSGHAESQMLDRYSHASVDRVRDVRGGLNDD